MQGSARPRAPGNEDGRLPVKESLVYQVGLEGDIRDFLEYVRATALSGLCIMYGLCVAVFVWGEFLRRVICVRMRVVVLVWLFVSLYLFDVMRFSCFIFVYVNRLVFFLTICDI